MNSLLSAASDWWWAVALLSAMVGFFVAAFHYNTKTLWKSYLETEYEGYHRLSQYSNGKLLFVSYTGGDTIIKGRWYYGDSFELRPGTSGLIFVLLKGKEIVLSTSSVKSFDGGDKRTMGQLLRGEPR